MYSPFLTMLPCLAARTFMPWVMDISTCRAVTKLPSPKILSASSFSWANSLLSMEMKMLPSGRSSFLARRRRLSMNDIHLLWRKRSSAPTKESSYMKSLLLVLYGGSMYMRPMEPRCVFSRSCKEARLSPSMRKFSGPELPSASSVSSQRRGTLR